MELAILGYFVRPEEEEKLLTFVTSAVDVTFVSCYLYYLLRGQECVRASVFVALVLLFGYV
jgi:hypothetical protein